MKIYNDSARTAIDSWKCETIYEVKKNEIN